MVCRQHAGLRLVALVVLISGLGAGPWGCGEEGPGGGAPVPGRIPDLRPDDGLLHSEKLQALVELQARRDGPALTERLGDPDPAIRARAAFALASVEWAGAREALSALLADPERAVRRDAAFALGQLELADGGRSLADALLREEDPQARQWMMETLGRAGDEWAVGHLLALDAGGEEAARIRALAKAMLRNVQPEGTLAMLAKGLTHPDPEVREAAAHPFGRLPEPELWGEHPGEVREALDGYGRDDPAAMHLTLALARLGDIEDLGRLLGWLREGEDWRIRVNVARGLGALPWLEREGVRGALFQALDDPSEHVAAIAARALTQGIWVPPHALEEMDGRIRGPAERWRAQAPFLRQLAQFHDPEAVVAWTRRMVRVHPGAVGHGLAALSGSRVADARDLILELARHSDPEIRAEGVGALSRSWQLVVAMGDGEHEVYEILVSALGDGPPRAAIQAARTLLHPSFLELGALDELHTAFHRRADAGELHGARTLLDLLVQFGDPSSLELAEEALRHDDPSIRRAAARALEEHRGRPVRLEEIRLGQAERDLDWEFLASLGPAPRLVVDTEKGRIVVRLVPDQAPLSVQALAEQAIDGLHDGVPFHRVVANFVAQGGDVVAGDGTGGPGYAIRSELNQLLFRRGVVGMASAGKDTEGSQFFLTHSAQPHLDGLMTAFGWVESGLEVLDRIYEGDRVVRMSVVPGEGS
jgi:cyclophilin family peptidyl-prolyl cis-trans isomerase/HEAT repeat protein